MVESWSGAIITPSVHPSTTPFFGMKNVVLLGSTGSIGTSTIKVAEDLPDRVRLVGLAAGGNTELLAKQTLKHRPEAVSLLDPAKAREPRFTRCSAGPAA